MGSQQSGGQQTSSGGSEWDKSPAPWQLVTLLRESIEVIICYCNMGTIMKSMFLGNRVHYIIPISFCKGNNDYYISINSLNKGNRKALGPPSPIGVATYTGGLTLEGPRRQSHPDSLHPFQSPSSHFAYLPSPISGPMSKRHRQQPKSRHPGPVGKYKQNEKPRHISPPTQKKDH